MYPDIDVTASTLRVAALHVCDAEIIVDNLRWGQREETGANIREAIHQRSAIVSCDWVASLGIKRLSG
jgi:hypothetical protein